MCADLLCEQYKLEGRVPGCAPRHGQASLLLMGVQRSPGSLADTRESVVLLLARGPGNANCHLCTHTSHRRGRPGGLTVCLQLTISLPHPPKQHSVGLAWCCEARIRVLAPLPVHAQTHPDRSNVATCLPSSLAEQACTPSSADLSHFARTRQRRHRIHARPCIASTGRGGSPAVLPTASRLLRPPVAII